MTEDEAKTKACCGPVGLIAATLLAAHPPKREQDAAGMARCVASACMAWRARPDHYVTDGPGTGQRLVQNDGYCGLAGAQS